MPIRALIRISWAIWSLPLMLVVLLAPQVTPDASGEGYAPALAAAQAKALVYLIPLTTLAAAREAGRLRAGGVLGQRSARSQWRVLVPGFVVSVAPVSVLFLAAHGARVRGEWGLAAVSLALLAAWAVFGVGLGAAFPLTFALPAALLTPAAWLILPPALEPLWLRHLTGVLEGCCLVGEVPDPRAVHAAALVGVGLAAAGALLCSAVGRRHARLRLTIAALPLVVAVALAAIVARPLGALSALPRPGPALCDNGKPTLCLWPEHEQLRYRVERIASTAATAWNARGIDVPTRFDEAQPQWGVAATAPLAVRGTATDADLLVSFAAAMVDPPQCATPGGIAQSSTDQTPVVAWLLVSAGMSEDAVTRRLGPDAVASARTWDYSPAGGATLNTVLRSIRECR